MSDFIPGLALSRLFYEEAVKPILDRHALGLRHSAALIGHGSEVLGYDTVRSTDHHWGPRLQLFLAERDLDDQRERLDGLLRAELPPTVRGFSTHFGAPDEEGVRLRQALDTGPVDHMVEISTVGTVFRDNLGLDPRAGITATDWLTFSEQHLLAVTAGEVFHDGLGELGPVREKLAYYPRDVWLYLLAAQC